MKRRGFFYAIGSVVAAAMLVGRKVNGHYDKAWIEEKLGVGLDSRLNAYATPIAVCMWGMSELGAWEVSIRVISGRDQLLIYPPNKDWTRIGFGRHLSNRELHILGLPPRIQ